ncbi:hypothetical protein NP233_g9733 [Leucocoprinus birnbaumii]|uniref:MFS general substrate transporter n=1 Tax=Leucocoprinus birnbaumii TaxID=56174 RepID=A0AAD5VKK2_9AGAR|nr:hypothetical protein NP233_g9733 [Leucocoprinus birnbaumii]
MGSRQTSGTSTTWHSAIDFGLPSPQPGSQSHAQSHPSLAPQSNATPMSSATTSRRSSTTYSPPEAEQSNHDNAFFVLPEQPQLHRHRRHSAYLSSHPHPYHPLPSPFPSLPATPSQVSIPSPTSPDPSFVSSHRPRALSTSAVLPPRSAHPARTGRPTRWFHGPAPCSFGLGSPLTQTLTNPRTRLEREISRDEREFQMYGGAAIREPPVKPAPAIGEEPDREVAAEREARSPEARERELATQVEAEAEDREGVEVEEEPTIDVNLVGWDGPDDPENPQNWSVKYKWFVTLICILMTVNVTFASSAPSSASLAVQAHFGLSREVSYLVTTTFLLGYVFGPLFWGPGSELTGRKPIFSLTLTLYTLFHLGQALAPNIQTLLVTRFFSGFFAVAPLTNCGGVIADIWPADRLFRGCCTLIAIPFLPETYAPVILLKKVKRLRKEDPITNKHLYAEHEKQDWSFKGVLNRTLFRPFKMLAMEPILVLVTIYLSIVYGLLYALFQAFPIIFSVRHHFNTWQTGLTFIGVGIGTTIGSLINFYSSLNYPQLITKWRGFPPAEERLIGAMIGAPTLVVGIFWMGWTGEYESVPWYVAGLSTIVVGTGISLIFMSFLSYLVDTYLMYSASAFAANTICRSTIAAAFPLFTVQMFTAMGVNWACTLIGLVSLLFMPSPFLFYKYGARIRSKSRFAPCIDLKIKKQIEEEEREKEKQKLQESKV